MSTTPLALVLACAVLAGPVAASAAPTVVPPGALPSSDVRTANPEAAGRILRVAGRRASGDSEAAGNMPGRYAVMRDKRDTGCMLTLDRAKVKGGSRAQLAPGCRDQGIVIFDPSSWTLVKGELVLTARAGHKTRMLRETEGAWKKATTDGKPLGLKKL